MFEGGEVSTERPTDATVVFLARHGETRWNVERRFQGHLDSDLSERGLEQARRLGQRLAPEPLRAVYSSDLGRTRRTAEFVAGPHGLSVHTHAGLRVIDCGEWTGRMRSDVRSVPEWAAMMDRYRQRPSEHRMPGGETIRDVQARALAFLGEVASRHSGQSIAVISHHVVVETMIAHAVGVPIEDLWLPYRGGNCFLSVLEIRAGVFRPKIIYDGDHIGELAGLDGTKGETQGEIKGIT